LPPINTLADITERWLLVCEGFGDGEFFKHLCVERGITGFQIEHLTNHQKHEPSGSGGFGRYIQGLVSRRGNPQVLLIVGDSDEEPTKNFEAIQKQIKKAKFVPPDNPLEVKRQLDGPALVVMMIPPPQTNQSAKGSLETLLLVSMCDNVPAIATCAEAYRACVGAAGWPITKADKMKLRSMIAGHWRDDPNISLGYALNPANGIIRLNHSCFDPVAGFLINFGTWLEAHGIS
jgi:hypothetical protein